MNEDIKVHVVDCGKRNRGGAFARTFFQMRYVDPLTNRQVKRSTKKTNRRDAERVAAKWEAELREGRYQRPTKTSWADFRDRYESDVLASLARSTDAKVGYVFDKLEADLAKALMSLPASKGFEIGSGFAGTTLTGSEHNDPYEMRQGYVRTRTNNSGGVQGGISIGEPILLPEDTFAPCGVLVLRGVRQELVLDGSLEGARREACLRVLGGS